MKTKNTWQIATCFIVAALLSIFDVSARDGLDSTIPIDIAPLPQIPENAPRVPSATRIAACYDEDGLIYVWLRNAGECVSVDIENLTTGAYVKQMELRAHLFCKFRSNCQ